MQSKDVICYGDTVYINLNHQVRRTHFTVNGISILIPELQPITKEQMSKDGFQGCIFQIYPKLSQSSVQELGQGATNENYQKQWDQTLKTAIQKFIGTPVLYGDVVQFLHYASKCFISYKPEDTKKKIEEGFRLIQTVDNDSSCFILDTISNYFYPGEKISYQTHLFIRTSTSSLYLNFSDLEFRSIDPANSRENIKNLAPLKLCAKSIPITMATLKRFGNPLKEESANYIKNGDFVRIYDSRLQNETLEAQKFYLEPNEQILDKPSSSLFLHLHDPKSQVSKRNNIMSSNSYKGINIFQIINPDCVDPQDYIISPKSVAELMKSPNEKQEKYILKHAITSACLEVPPEAESQVKISPYNAQNLEKHTITLLKPSDSLSLMSADSSVLIAINRGYDVSFLSQIFQEDKDLFIKTLKGERPNESALGYELFKGEKIKKFELQWNKETNLTECLRCEKIDDEELHALNFFLSCRKILLGFSDDLESLRNNIYQNSADTYMRAIGLIQEVNALVVKTVSYIQKRTINVNIQKDERCDPSITNQHFLEDFKIVDLLNKFILKISMISNHYQDFNLAEEEICQTLFENFGFLLQLYIFNNPHHTNQLMRNIQIYLRPEILPKMNFVIIETLQHSEFVTLSVIVQILNHFVFEKNTAALFSPRKDTGAKVLKILMAVSKFKSFCIGIQRYKSFWNSEYLSQIFPKITFDETRTKIRVFFQDLSFNLEEFIPKHRNREDINYIITSFEFMIALAKNIPNFKRLFKEIKLLVPFEECLFIISKENLRKYSKDIKSIFLDILLSVHYKSLTYDSIKWSSTFIFMKDQNLKVVPDNEWSANTMLYRLQIKLLELFNWLKFTIEENIGKDLELVTEDIEVLSQIIKSNLIEFRNKIPWLIFYSFIINLRDKIIRTREQQAQIPIELYNGVLKHLSSVITVISSKINSYFLQEFLEFIIKGRSNELVSNSQLFKEGLDRKLIEFFEVWDNSLEKMGKFNLTLKRVIHSDLENFANKENITAEDLNLLSKFSSIKDNLILKMKEFIIIEDESEVKEINYIKAIFIQITDLIETLSPENQNYKDSYKKAEQLFEEILIELQINSPLISSEELNQNQIPFFLIENQKFFKFAPKTKLQDSILMIDLLSNIIDIFDCVVLQDLDGNAGSKLKLYCFLFLLYVIQSNERNALEVHKLLFSSYLYEIYQGKIYPPDVICYLQMILHSIYSSKPSLLENENESKTLFEYFYSPYLKKALSFSENLTNYFKSGKQRFELDDNQRTDVQLVILALNSLQSFSKGSISLIKILDANLRPLFTLSTETFSHYVSDSSKGYFGDLRSEQVWLQYYQGIIANCQLVSQYYPPLKEFLLQSIGLIYNLNKFLLKLKASYSIPLKSELINLGSKLFTSFSEEGDNKEDKIIFTLIVAIEILRYLKEMVFGQADEKEFNEIIDKIKDLTIWDKIQQRYGADLLQRLKKTEGQMLQSDPIVIFIQIETILKFFDSLIKYNPKIIYQQLKIKGQQYDSLNIGQILLLFTNSLKFSESEKSLEVLTIAVINSLADIVTFIHLLGQDGLKKMVSSGKSPTPERSRVYTCIQNLVNSYFASHQATQQESLVSLVVSLIQTSNSEKILRRILIGVQQIPNQNVQSFNFICSLIKEIIVSKLDLLQKRISDFEFLIPHVNDFQNIFNQYFFVEFLFKSMLETNSEKELINLLDLSNILLFGGNEEIQKNFYDCFMRDLDNRLILKLSSCLKKLTEKYQIRERLRYQTLKLMRRKTELRINEIYEAKSIKKILTFIKLLCENHNSQFQHFFKEQSHEKTLNSITVNFPIKICNYINSYIDLCSAYNIDLGHQLFTAITEIVQGNNRDIINEMCTRTTIVNDILQFLDFQIIRVCDQNNGFSMLRSDAIILLQSIVESSDSATKDLIAHQINYQLLLKAVINQFDQAFSKKGINLQKMNIKDLVLTIKDDDFIHKGEIGDGLNVLIIIKVLEDFSQVFQKRLHQFLIDADSSIKEKFETYMKKLGLQLLQSIEINDSDKTLRRVYFPKLSSCFFLDKTTRDQIIERIDRTTYHVKISEFLSDAEEVHYKMRNQFELHYNQLFYRLTQIYPKAKRYNRYLTYVINVFMIFYMENEDLSSLYRYNNLTTYLYYFINLGQLLLAVIIFGLWFATNEQMFELRTKWTIFNKNNLKKMDPITFEEEKRWKARPEAMTEQDFIRILYLRGPYSEELRPKKFDPLTIPGVRYIYLKQSIKFLLSSGTFINNLILIINCGLPLIAHPIFVSFQLINTLAESKIMQSVVGSFYKNAIELGVTLKAGAYVIFIYALIGFFFLQDGFYVEDYGNVCTSIWHCFLSIMDYGLRSGGGIGDVLKHEAYTTGDMYLFTTRWFFDITFFILIAVIMLNLVFGLVIDTFGDIRSEKIANQEDQTARCFICDIDRGMIERVGNGFEKHALREHNMWNYLFYLYYLKQKGVINLSEVEDRVYKCYKNKDMSWIPYSKAICLEGKLGEDDELGNQISDLKNEIKNFISRIEKSNSH